MHRYLFDFINKPITKQYTNKALRMTFKKLAIFNTQVLVHVKKKDSLLDKEQIYSIKCLACPANTLTLYIVVCMNIISFKDKSVTVI